MFKGLNLRYDNDKGWLLQDAQNHMILICKDKYTLTDRPIGSSRDAFYCDNALYSIVV